ncbi:MAG: alkaline phosphatase family protein [Ignavibacteriaceae bacterium]
MNKKICTAVSFLLIFIFNFNLHAQLPKPKHVIVIILENHSFKQIIGSPAAPYINSLVKDNSCALFTQYYAITHPSQPNYLALFSGSVNGVPDDELPKDLPFTTPNLGAELLKHEYSFAGYCEDLPSIGYNGKFAGPYARKHNPWVNWQDAKKNGIPKKLNLPFTSFPKNYNLLPTISFVIPNLNNDMHDGKEPERISKADTWIKENLNGYIQWAKKHNSLLIITMDEDNNTSVNLIPTLFIGQMVKHGEYSEKINHYSLLRTLEDMYHLPHAGQSSEAAAIKDCWLKSRR